MSTTGNSAAATFGAGRFAGCASRGVSVLTMAEMHEIEAHRAKDRPTPWAHLAARYGVNELDLRALFDRSIERPATPKPAPVLLSASTRNERFRALWAAGASKAEIGYQLAIGKSTIDRLRVDLGLPKRTEGSKPNGWTEDEDAYIRLHYVVLGETAESVAKTLGRSRFAVIGRAHRNGWTRQTLRGLAA